jgi:enamine deaminase RidA (YjgF/YER057c/UK114 family)
MISRRSKRPPRDNGVESVPDSRFPISLGPPASGYSHGMSAEGRTIVTAGQIGWDAATGKVVDGGFVAQTRQALANVAAVLAAGNAQPAHLVRLTWFITDRAAYLDNRKAIGAAYRETIGIHFPAMSVIVVAGLLEPGAMVEIEATAVVPPKPRPSPSRSSKSNSTGARRRSS